MGVFFEIVSEVIMNVVRVENTLAPARGRGRGRAGKFAPNSTPTINVVPKYDFHTDRQLFLNIDPSNTNLMVTPKNTRRYQTTSSFSGSKRTLHRRGGQSSSGSRISPHSISTDPDHCVIIAITSGRGDARGEVGMAAIDVQYPHMILCQISDCNTYINTLTKIHTLHPIEIIMPDTMCERSIHTNGLYHAIREKFESLMITPVARMHFHDTSGMDRIRTHCAEEFSSVELFVKQKYYALAAVSALFKYVEYIQHIIYAPKSMRIEFQGSRNAAFIDIESAESLELVTPQDSGGTFSLLSCLDRCSTPMGRRLLRASILQPPFNLDLIKARQACVAEFVKNRSFHSIVKPVVKRLYGASRLLSLAILTSQADSVQAAEKNLNYILLLKNIVDIIPELRSVIANGQAPFFQKVAEDLEDPRFQTIKAMILSVVHAEAQSVMGFVPLNLQRCFAIRSGLNDMLDLARQTYCELIDDMQTYTKKLSERYNLPLFLGCNAALGYHIEMDVRQSQNIRTNELPEELIEVHKQKSKIFMTTNCLLVLGQHCRDACAELHIMSNVLLNEILTNIREHIGCLLKLNDNVGELDLLMSMAQVSSISDYVVPIFGQRLELRDSRHPIMDISGNDSPVSNDVVATVAHNFNTITGPNMSGKSVYLKQIVLLQIMAQIGYYVPAKKAQFRVADRIFCRMCSRDDVESDASTFVLEIKEAQYIIQSVTANSLVILDELCRGTTVEEGTSIAWSICEKLLRTSAFTFNATHFLYLTRLSEFYYNVKNHYFETESHVSEATNCNDSRMIYTHRLKPGIASVWNYGIALARSTGLPEAIVALARNFADEIAKSVKPLEAKNETNLRKKKCYDCFVEMCGLLERDQFTVNNLVKLVNEFQIPSVMRELFREGMMKERKKQNMVSSDFKMAEKKRKDRTERKEVQEIKRSAFYTNNFEQRNIQYVPLTKRLSTTSISSDSDEKKPRIRLNKDKSSPCLSQFNYLRQAEAMKSSRKIFRVTSENLAVNEKSNLIAQGEKHPMEYFGDQRTRANLLYTQKLRSGTQRIDGENYDERLKELSSEISRQSTTSSEVNYANSENEKHPVEYFGDQRARMNLIYTQELRSGIQRIDGGNYDERFRESSSEISRQSTTSSEVDHANSENEKHPVEYFGDQRARINLMYTQEPRSETQKMDGGNYDERLRVPSLLFSSQSATSSGIHHKNYHAMQQNEKQPMEFFEDQRARAILINTQNPRFQTQGIDRPVFLSQSAMSSEVRDKNSHSIGQGGKDLMKVFYNHRARAYPINTRKERFGTQRNNRNDYESLKKPRPNFLSQSSTSSEIHDKISPSMWQNEKHLTKDFDDQRARANLINMQKEKFGTQRSSRNDYESSSKPKTTFSSQSSTSSEAHDKNSDSMGQSQKQHMENFGHQRIHANLIDVQKKRFETQRSNTNDCESFEGPSPEFISLSSTSQGHHSQALSTIDSQMSVDTYIAQKSARKKEADVFRIIEGNDFDEAAFYGSIQSIIKIDSDEEFV